MSRPDRERVSTICPQDLPRGWATSTLPELIAADGLFSDGDWVESKDQDPNGDVRLIQLADVGDGEYRDRSARFLTQAKAQELGCSFLRAGDVLIARMPDPLGRACVFPGDEKPAVTVVDVCIARPGEQSVNNRWLMHCINARPVRSAIAGLQSGTTRQRISRGNLATLELPIPPLAEQRRIVAAIEEQFTRLDAGVAALRRAQAALKRYRAAVLKAAVEGRLTEAWRAAHPDAEPASALLGRILAERRAQWDADLRAKGKDPVKARYEEPQPPQTEGLPELPQGWRYTSLEPLLSYARKGMTTGPFGTLLSKSDHKGDGIAVLGIENIDRMRFVPGSKIHISQEKAAELSGYRVVAGDVLISRSGTVGEVCVVPKGLGDAIISTNLMRVSLAGRGFLPAFFATLFNGSPLVLKQVRELCKGSTRDFLNQHILSSLVFPLPPFAEQEAIVAEVERLLSVISEVEATVAANLKRAERLRQAILERAFTGRLVPQDPADEPASALLEQIRRKREMVLPRKASVL